MYEEFFSRRLAQLRAQKGVSAREMSLGWFALRVRIMTGR